MARLSKGNKETWASLQAGPTPHVAGGWAGLKDQEYKMELLISSWYPLCHFKLLKR